MDVEIEFTGISYHTVAYTNVHDIYVTIGKTKFSLLEILAKIAVKP